MNRETKRNVIFLLGAGTSSEAGVYTTGKITDILVNYSSYCSSEESVAIENLLKYIQVRIADYMQVRASDINFEFVLGTLMELSKRQEYPVVPLLGDADLIVKKLEQKMPLTRVVDKLYAMLRELLFLRYPVDYLYPLRDFLKRPLDFFTLNYDLALETAFTNLNISYTTGYRKRGSELPIWDPSEFVKESYAVRVFKLHGSIDWGQYYLFPPPTRSEPDTDATNAAEDFIYNYPERVMFDPFPIGEVKPPERAHGMVSLMNFGTRKELLYASSQFNTLFHFFLEALYRADFLVIAGYSFRDDKVNKMIEEAVVTKKGDLHVVIVNPSLYWLEYNDPMLWKFGQLKWTTGIPKAFGEALRDGSLIDAIETFVKGDEADKEVYPLGGIEADNQGAATEVKPNVENILKMWELLGDTIDLTYFRMRLIAPELRGLEECATGSEAIKVGNVLMPLLRKVRDLCHHIRWVYKEMCLGGTYGEAYLENIKVEPKPTNDFSRIELVRKWLPALERTVSYVPSLYGGVTEEFKHAVTDPHYAESIEAPNNISAAELVIRKTKNTIYELVWILNDIFKGAGYEEPFEMIAKHQAGDK